MAYAASGLSLLAHGNGQRIFHYRTADAINTVMGSAYFANAVGQFNVGDRIICRSSYGGTEQTWDLSVTNATTPVVRVSGGGEKRIQSIAFPITVTAVASTEFTTVLPPCVIVRAGTMTYTAFTGATVTIQHGTALAGQEIVAATTIKAAGAFAHTVVAAGANFAGGTVYTRVAQTSTETAVGAAVTFIEFVPN